MVFMKKTYDAGMSTTHSKDDFEKEFVEEKGEAWIKYREDWEKF